jgi:hypothetical protein
MNNSNKKNELDKKHLVNTISVSAENGRIGD